MIREGDKIGALRVIECMGVVRGKREYLVECDCGRIVVMLAVNIRRAGKCGECGMRASKPARDAWAYNRKAKNNGTQYKDRMD